MKERSCLNTGIASLESEESSPFPMVQSLIPDVLLLAPDKLRFHFPLSVYVFFWDSKTPHFRPPSVLEPRAVPSQLSP